MTGVVEFGLDSSEATRSKRERERDWHRRERERETGKAELTMRMTIDEERNFSSTRRFDVVGMVVDHYYCYL